MEPLPQDQKIKVTYKLIIQHWFSKSALMAEENDRLRALDSIPPAIRRANPNMSREFYLRHRSQPFFLLNVAFVCPEAARQLSQAALTDLAQSMGLSQTSRPQTTGSSWPRSTMSRAATLPSEGMSRATTMPPGPLASRPNTTSAISSPAGGAERQQRSREGHSQEQRRPIAPSLLPNEHYYLSPPPAARASVSVRTASPTTSSSPLARRQGGDGQPQLQPQHYQKQHQSALTRRATAELPAAFGSRPVPPPRGTWQVIVPSDLRPASTSMAAAAAATPAGKGGGEPYLESVRSPGSRNKQRSPSPWSADRLAAKNTAITSLPPHTLSPEARKPAGHRPPLATEAAAESPAAALPASSAGDAKTLRELTEQYVEAEQLTQELLQQAHNLLEPKRRSAGPASDRTSAGSARRSGGPPAAGQAPQAIEGDGGPATALDGGARVAVAQPPPATEGAAAAVLTAAEAELLSEALGES